MHKTKQLTEKPSKLKRIFSPGYPCVNSTLMCNFHNPSPLMPIIWHTDNFTTIWNPSSPILGTIPPAQQPAKGFCLDLWRRIWLTTMGHFLSLTLKLASNQLHTASSNWCQGSHSKLKGTLIEFLSKIILTVTTSVTWRSKFSAVFLQLQYASAQL